MLMICANTLHVVTWEKIVKPNNECKQACRNIQDCWGTEVRDTSTLLFEIVELDLVDKLVEIFNAFGRLE